MDLLRHYQRFQSSFASLEFKSAENRRRNLRVECASSQALRCIALCRETEINPYVFPFPEKNIEPLFLLVASSARNL